jgi:hypothetical protein
MSDDLSQYRITSAEAAVLLECSERHARRLCQAAGIIPECDRYSVRDVVRLAINRAIAGSEEATRSHLEQVRARLRWLESRQ